MKHEAQNREEEDEAMKKKQIPMERKQIRYTAPPRTPLEPRKTKEERLPPEVPARKTVQRRV
jgi:hypothetical protein